MLQLSLAELQAPHPLVQAGNLATASAKWRVAGMPMRTPEQIAECYAECLNRCPKYAPTDPSRGQCLACGCNVSAEFSTWNKIALATEVCPLGRWPKRKDTDPLDPLVTPYGDNGKPNPSCCGSGSALVEALEIKKAADKFAGIPNYGGKPIAKFTEFNLAKDVPGMRFNGSLLLDPTGVGEYLMSFRSGWAGSQIYLVRLDKAFNPLGNAWMLDLHHPLEAAYGREDSRLFLHNNRVHVAYAGVQAGSSKLHTSVLYARLTADCTKVEARWYPYYPHRNEWEKNHSYLSHGGEIFAIYSVSPHRVLHIDGHRAELVYNEPNGMQWHGGELRGGASPVLVGGEWWHFVHDRIIVNGLKVYRTGLYTFANEPPFKPVRYLPEPLLVADRATKGDNYAAVVFTTGAVKTGDDWILSGGGMDRWQELHRFSHAELERNLINVI